MKENKAETHSGGLTPSLWAIVLLGIILRFLRLGRQSLWIDEGFSWMATQLNFDGVTQLSWTDVHPPLYYYLLKISLWFLPDNEFGMRVVSVLCSIATLVVMIRFVYRHWGQRAACYVGLLAALSPFDIYYAQEARMYALLAFLFALAFTELVEALEGSPVHLIGWVIANVGLAWTHAYGLLTVFFQIGFFVCYGVAQYLRGRTVPLNPKAIIAAFIVLFLGVTPIVVLFWMIRGNASGSVLLPESNRLLYLVRCWTTGPMHAFPAYKIPWRVHDLTAVVMVGCAVVGAWQLWKRDEWYRWVLLFALALVVMPAAIIYAYSALTKHALWIDRGFLGSAHVLYLLAGVGLAAMGSCAVRGIAAVVIGISLVTGEIYYFTRFEKSQAAVAFHSLPSITSQHVLLLTPSWLNDEAYYYLRVHASYWGIDPKTPGQLLQVSWPAGQMSRSVPVECGSTELATASEVYVFGDLAVIQQERNQWPSCLASKKLWIFEKAHWQPLDE